MLSPLWEALEEEPRCYTLTRNNVTDFRESEEKEARQKNMCVLENKAGERNDKERGNTGSTEANKI